MRYQTSKRVQYPPEFRMSTGSLHNFAMLLAILYAVEALGNDSPARTGKAMETALAAKISWSSSGTSLRETVQDFQQQSGVLVLCDRHIDPRQLLTIEINGLPRFQVLRKIAASIPGGAFCVTERFVWLGSAERVNRLPALTSQSLGAINSGRKKIPTPGFRKLTATVDVRWEKLAEPRQILLDTAKTAGARILNPEAVPHDVWEAGELPGTTFAELATLILNQFDLKLQAIEGSPDFSIEPVNMQAITEHRYAVGAKLRQPVTAAWQQQAPEANVRWTGSTAIVSATLRQHTILNSIVTDLRYTATDSGTSGPPANSLRTTKFQLRAERDTLGGLIDYFQSNNVRIDVANPDSPQTKAVLAKIIRVDEIAEEQNGEIFFKRIFGQHFQTVKILDDRVVLSVD